MVLIIKMWRFWRYETCASTFYDLLIVPLHCFVTSHEGNDGGITKTPDLREAVGIAGPGCGLRLRRALDRPFQRPVQPGAGSFVLRQGDAALFALHFELK
jgi:hypothetical protein